LEQAVNPDRVNNRLNNCETFGFNHLFDKPIRAHRLNPAFQTQIPHPKPATFKKQRMAHM